MIIDPVQAFEAIKPTSSVSPIPTIVPTLPDYQVAGEAGQRTLW